jgi:hypothetical protein
MRLRPLTEAECYARCYGERSDDCVRIVPLTPPRSDTTRSGERLRALFEERLDARGPEQEAEAA